MESTALSLAYVGVLLDKGADPNVTTSLHVAPLVIAGMPDMVWDRFGFNRNKRGPLIDLLLAHGADPYPATMNNVPLLFADIESPVFRERVQAHIEAHPPTQERFLEALQQAWISEKPERVSVMLDQWLSDAFKLGVEPELILGRYRAQVPVLEARILQQATEAVPMAAVERPRSRL